MLEIKYGCVGNIHVKGERLHRANDVDDHVLRKSVIPIMCRAVKSKERTVVIRAKRVILVACR